MSIANRITSIENNIRNAYHGLDSIGIDTTNTNKNIENISALLDDFYDTLPKVSGTGTNISLSPTKVGRLKSQINGNTFQQTYTGKNLLEDTMITTATEKNGITATPVYENGLLQYINFNGTATKNTYFNISRQNFGETSFNSDTGGSTEYIATSDNETLRLTYDASNNYSYFYVANGRSVSNEKAYPMIRLASVSDSNYEPFVGGTASPNPEFPQSIESVTGLQKISVGGKNLFKDTLRQGTYNNVNDNRRVSSLGTLYLYAGTTYTFSTDLDTSNYWYGLRLKSTPYLNGVSDSFYDSGWKAQSSFSFTPAQNGYFMITIRAKEESSSTTITPSDMQNVKLQIEKGSTATTYEAYSGETYEINLGKNLFDGELENGSYSTSTGQKENNNNIYRNKNIINVQPNTTYTLSINGFSQRYCLYFYDSSQAYLGSNLTLTTGTFTTPNNCKYINFRCFGADYTSDFSNLKVQLEKGNQATSYSEYFTPIELNKIGDYKDYITGTPDNWSIVNQIGTRVLNGTEKWNDRPNYNYADRFVFSTSGFTDSSNYIKGFTNYFLLKNHNSTNTYPYITYASGSQFLVNFSQKGTVSLEQFKEWLSEHNVICKYIALTPTTTPITDTTLINDLNNFYYAKSKQGQTNISVEGNLPIILDVSALKEVE